MIQNFYAKLLAAGVPVSTATDDGTATFSRTLNDVERQAYYDIISPPSYAELRRREYPPLAELADALYWQAEGDGSFMERYLEKCAMVKVTYPKPG